MSFRPIFNSSVVKQFAIVNLMWNVTKTIDRLQHIVTFANKQHSGIPFPVMAINLLQI